MIVHAVEKCCELHTHILYSIPDARIFYETLISSSSVLKPNVVMNPTV